MKGIRAGPRRWSPVEEPYRAADAPYVRYCRYRRTSPACRYGVLRAQLFRREPQGGKRFPAQDFISALPRDPSSRVKRLSSSPSCRLTNEWSRRALGVFAGMALLMAVIGLY